MKKGQYFSVEKGKCVFFGFQGELLYGGKAWGLYPKPYGKKTTLINGIYSPSSVGSQVDELVAQAVNQWGEQDLIVFLSSHYGVLFYLEGRLNENHFARAREEDEEIVIDGVDFNGHSATLVIVDIDETDSHISIGQL